MENKNSKALLWFKKNLTIKAITANAFIAAIYAVITILCAPLSYSFSQFRFSEALNLLVFFNPTYTIGLTLGCFLANIASTAGPLDLIFGTLGTLISCLLMIGLSKLWKNLFFAGLIPSIINAIVVPLVIYYSCLGTADEITNLETMYWIMFGFVFLGEFVTISCVGYPIIMSLLKYTKGFSNYILATRNLDFKW